MRRQVVQQSPVNQGTLSRTDRVECRWDRMGTDRKGFGIKNDRRLDEDSLRSKGKRRVGIKKWRDEDI